MARFIRALYAQQAEPNSSVGPHTEAAHERMQETIASNEFGKARSRRICSCVTASAPGKLGRGNWIRTSDLMVPNHAHYQAVLYPETRNVADGREALKRRAACQPSHHA